MTANFHRGELKKIINEKGADGSQTPVLNEKNFRVLLDAVDYLMGKAEMQEAAPVQQIVQPPPKMMPPQGDKTVFPKHEVPNS